MEFRDVVFYSSLLAFFVLNEDFIAKAPRWKQAVNLFEFSISKIFTWRANADIKTEIRILMQHFERMTAVLAVITIITMYLHSRPLIRWMSIALVFSMFATISFRWTFKHGETLRPFGTKLCYAFAFPLALFFLDKSADSGLMLDIIRLVPFLPFHPNTSIGATLLIEAGICAVVATYYLLGWLCFSPFAYVVLGLLKASRFISIVLVKKFKRSILRDLSITVTVFGMIYLYQIGK